MEAETILDALALCGAIGEEENDVLQKVIDEHKRFKEFVDELHHLMSYGIDVLPGDDFTAAISVALEKADPEYYK